MIRRALLWTLMVGVGLGTFSLASVAGPSASVLTVQRGGASLAQTRFAERLGAALGLEVEAVGALRQDTQVDGRAVRATGVEVDLGQLMLTRLSPRADAVEFVTHGLPLAGDTRRVVEVRGGEVLVVSGASLSARQARRVLRACCSERPARLLAVIEADGAYASLVREERAQLARAVRANLGAAPSADLESPRIAAHLASQPGETLSVVAGEASRVHALQGYLSALRN